MREFSEFEKRFLERISSIIDNDNYHEISLARIIRQEVDAFAITWDKSKNGKLYVEIWVEEKSNETLNRLISVITLLKELSDKGLILLCPSNGNIDKYLCDRDKFKYEDGVFVDGNGNKYEFEDYGGHEHYSLNGYLELYANQYVYPSGALMEFVRNKFKTPEQIRFETQLNDTQRKHKQEMQWTRITAGVSFIGLLIALLLPFCTKTTLAEKDEILNTIQSVKTEFPLVMKTKITNDTIKVDAVKPTPIKNK